MMSPVHILIYNCSRPDRLGPSSMQEFKRVNLWLTPHQHLNGLYRGYGRNLREVYLSYSIVVYTNLDWINANCYGKSGIQLKGVLINECLGIITEKNKFGNKKLKFMALNFLGEHADLAIRVSHWHSVIWLLILPLRDQFWHTPKVGYSSH